MLQVQGCGWVWDVDMLRGILSSMSNVTKLSSNLFTLLRI